MSIHNMDTQNIRVAIIGVTGYTGIELVSLITTHPNFHLTVATSRSQAGKILSDVHPFLKGLPGTDIIISEPDPITLANNCDLAFLAVPHGLAMELAATLISQHIKVIDLSSDFRLNDATTYTQWYNMNHLSPQLLSEAVYGIPELNEHAIRTANLVANPGCYPTSVILGLFAALKHELVDPHDILIDSKSGVSGAGKKASETSLLFCEVYNSFKAYNVGKHRHTPEIEQQLSIIANMPIVVSFTPHLLPINRGILSTIYTRLKKLISQNKVHHIYTETWKKYPWIRIVPSGTFPETRNVQNTMFCDLSVTIDQRTQRLIIVSAIDNLCRGASGQAIANANLMFGLPMTTGLILHPTIP